MVKRQVKLDYLQNNYRRVLWDACGCEKSGSFKEKVLSFKRCADYYRDASTYIDFVCKNISRDGNFFVTGLVKEELEKSGMTYKRRIKRARNASGDKLDYLRACDEFHRNRNLLARVFFEEDKVVFPKDKWDWSLDYSMFKNFYKEFAKKHELSDADEELLFLGAAIANNKEKIAVISNDIPLQNSWRDFMRSQAKKKWKSFNSFDFFFRQNKNAFYKIYPLGSFVRARASRGENLDSLGMTN